MKKRLSDIFRTILFPSLLLPVFLCLGGCGLYNDYNLKGEYKLVSGEYYDGRMYTLSDFEGKMDLSTTTYSMEYTLSFTKTDLTEISESRDESGSFNYTSEYETATYGSDENMFSGYIFFTPTGESEDEWDIGYEYYKKSDVLVFDSYRHYSQLGYYVTLRWEKK